MTSTQVAANPAELATIEGFPSIDQEAEGLLKMVWQLSEIEDDWTKGGSLHPAWDRWTYWPYLAKTTYNLTFALRMLGKIAQDGEAWPRGIINHILGFSRAGGAGSTARMYNEPNMKKFEQPTLSGVDYPNLTVRQAAYDEGKRALAIAICPGQDASPVGAPTSLTITNLPGQAKVQLDGQPCDTVTDKGDGTIEIGTTVGEHTIVVQV